MTFSEVYRRYYKFVLKNFRKYPREQAEEYTQDVFIAVYKTFHKYDPKYKITTFLVSNIVNVKYDIQQYEKGKDRKNAIFVRDNIEMLNIADDGSVRKIEEAERCSDARKIVKLSPLNGVEKKILLLVLDGKTLKEIGPEIGRDYGYVKLYGRQALRKISSLNASVS